MMVKVTGMITEVEWKAGRPEKDGEYVVITKNGSVATYEFTVEWGWNTHPLAHDSAIEDSHVLFWTSDFRGIIDKYARQ